MKRKRSYLENSKNETLTQQHLRAPYKTSRTLYIIEAALEYFIAILVAETYLAKIAMSIGISDAGGWSDDFVYSLKTISNYKGTAFFADTMLRAQQMAKGAL